MQDQELIEGGRDLFRPVLLLVAPQWWYGLRLKLLGAPASTVSRGVTSQLLHPLLQMVGPNLGLLNACMCKIEIEGDSEQAGCRIQSYHHQLPCKCGLGPVQGPGYSSAVPRGPAELPSLTSIS